MTFIEFLAILGGGLLLAITGVSFMALVSILDDGWNGTRTRFASILWELAPLVSPNKVKSAAKKVCRQKGNDAR